MIDAAYLYVDDFGRVQYLRPELLSDEDLLDVANLSQRPFGTRLLRELHQRGLLAEAYRLQRASETVLNH
jgi:hypothetical protein